jgi:hypothetical protein
MRLRRIRPGLALRAVAVMASFAVLGGFWLLTQSSAYVAPPTVYLTPDAGTYAPSTQFSLQVRMNSATTAVNAVQAEFTYPAALLEVVSVDTTASAFTTQAETTVAADRIIIARGTVGGTSISGDQLIATVNFRTRTTSGDAVLAFVTGTQLVDAINNTDLLGGSMGRTSGATIKVDGTPPTVSVTAPANGASVAAGSTVAVTAAATDSASAITAVEIYIDSVKVATLTASPYTYNWNTAGLALNSSHTLQARATDAIGNIGSSAISTVTIADRTPPTVSVTAPASNASVRGTVALNANAADNAGGSGIARVEFYVSGTKVGEDLTSPYSFSWNSALVADGSRPVTAIAYDNASPANATTSPAVTILVDNTAPSAPPSLTAGTPTQSSVVLNWTGSSSSDVTGYRIANNGTTVTTTGASARTYTVSNLAPGTSYNFTVVALDAAGNTSAPASLTTSTAAPKPGDINLDNFVNITDLSILLSNWNSTSNTASDFNRNGRVDIIDLSILISNWGK